MPTPNVEDLKTQQGELVVRMSAIQKLADDASRDMTKEEAVEFDALGDDFERMEIDIKRREKAAAFEARASAGTGRRTVPDDIVNRSQQQQDDPPARRGQPDTGLRNTNLPTAQDRGRWGYHNLGEFLNSVRHAEITGQIDQRIIRNAASTFGVESVGEDGGFTIPPDWRADIMKMIAGEESLLSRTDQQTTSSNAIVVPVDESAPWYATGVRAFWTDEAQVKTQSKPVISMLTVRAHKIAALVYMSDELLSDSNSMANFVQSKAPIAINWQINDALINGTGVGKPLGILNSPALISVAKETGQVANTLVPANIYKMYARMLAAWRSKSVWVYNQDIEPQLFSMITVVKNVAGTENVGGGFPLYIPPGGLRDSPNGTLLGRPMIASEACPTLGTQGDIILVDWDMYLSVVKSGIRQDVSIHVEFERDLTAFRFVMRVGGQPWLSAPVTRASGSNTLSPFVTLDTRG